MSGVAAVMPSANLALHCPVLLPAALEALAIKPDGVYIDATFGRGGHSNALLERLAANGRLIVVDKDPEAITYATRVYEHESRVRICHASFAQLTDIGAELLGQVDGILFDLGVSSPQLADPARGFSFQKSGVLDMRMNTSTGMTVAEYLQQLSEPELANIIYVYGQERWSRRIAKAIVRARALAPLTTTQQLSEIVEQAVPRKYSKIHPATRTFMALRIAINNELAELTTGLQQALALLRVGGRMVVISFHSLEDRIVKRFMRPCANTDEMLPLAPAAQIRMLGRIRPQDNELAYNSRARSAILRFAEKL